jgi:glutathione S-transferase
VQDAERWGEEVLQPVPRRLTWWAARHDRSRSALRTMGEGARLHVPTQLAVRTSPPIIRIEVRLNGATDAAVQSDLASLPRMLDQVTTWLDEGVLGHQPPNAADYQIATSIRLLLCFDDLHDRIDQSLATYARQVVPHFPGKLTAVFPRSWIARAHER